MTLVEVIVSFAIIAIVAAVMVSAFLMSANATSRGNAFTHSDEVIDAAIASNVTTNIDAVDVGLSLDLVGGGTIAVIPGKVYTYTDPETGDVFRVVGK
ncbi:MAG: type II secretion system GspH family protein [Clostridiales Family XIII bacterium]|nr:type II secretion system GspH family protein [Clostridiales Family XIII bacterium]